MTISLADPVLNDPVADILLAEDKLQDAEVAARQCIAMAEQHLPDDWRLQEARSLLGEDLTGQKKFSEAEPLLLAGYERIEGAEGGVPDSKKQLAAAIRRLADFYRETSRPDEADKWSKFLEVAK